MQTIYGVTSGENIVQAFTEENTTEANFHQSINNAAILTFTTTEPLKDGVRFFLTKDPINDYKNEEFMYFEITDQDFDGYEYTYRAEEYAYHDLDTMGYVKNVYRQGMWTTRSLLESITYNDVEPKGIARTKWQIVDNDLTLPTTWAGEGDTYTLWYNTPLRGIEKFIEYFGGEIRFYVTIVNNKISGHFLEIYEKRGRETGKRYESNSNLISLTNKAEYGDRYEYIIPLAEGGGTSGDEQKNNTPNGFNNYITLDGLEVGESTDDWYKPASQLYVSLANDKNAYPLKSQPKGLQNNPRIKPVTFDEVKSKEALFDKAIEWLENNQGVAWSYSASVLDIGESQIGDTIAIIDERSGISSYVRVHDIDYDMIDPENTGVHFGSNWGYENDEAITDMLNTATTAQRDTIGLIDTAIRQSNGKNTNYYGENEPADPIEGDLWYWKKGDESGIKIYQDGNWVDLVDSNTLKHINEQVDKALSDAKTYSDNLSTKNKEYTDAAKKALNESIDDFQHDIDNNIGEIKRSIIKTNDGVSELDRTVKGFQSKVEDYDGNVATFNQTVEGFRSQVEGYKGEVTTFNQTADTIMASVSTLSTPNKLFNTEFSPDLEGWDIYKPDGGGDVYRSYVYNASNGVGFDTTNATDGHYGVIEQFVTPPNTIDENAVISMRWNVRTATKGDTTWLFIAFIDKNDDEISAQHVDWSADNVGGVEEHKFENVAIPTGTTKIKVSFQAAKGNQQYLWKPMLVFNSSAPLSYMAGSYSGMNTSTVLTLAKDNFALGIKDNTQNIISGINGDSSGLVISGKKIVVDGDTTFTGNNFMNASIIADGTIGTAKIGDLAVTSGKISDLDVDKLSGNVTNFVKSHWSDAYDNVTIAPGGMAIIASTGTHITISSLNATGAHFQQGNITANYQFTPWVDSSGKVTDSIGLNLGAVGSDNSYMNFVGTGGGSYMLYAGSNMNYGANANIVKDELNIFSKVNIRSRIEFKSNPNSQPTYIEANELTRSLNFYTDEGFNPDSSAINYFWFNHDVSASGTFNGMSLLSKKNIKSNFDTDALSEIAKTQLVNFEYKNNIGANHVSPIIDDVNEEKQYYVPEKILAKDKEHVDLYSMISMAWKAIQQLNERINS